MSQFYGVDRSWMEIEVDQTLIDRCQPLWSSGRQYQESAEDLIIAAHGDRTPAYYAHVNALVRQNRPKCVSCGEPIARSNGIGGSTRYCEKEECDYNQMPHPSGETKPCEECGTDFRRKLRDNDSQWAGRRFCTPSCATQYQVRQLNTRRSA